MRNDQNETLDDLLARWHVWSQGQWHLDGGWYGVNAASRSYRVSRQHDDCNGALDDDIDTQIMRGVDAAIESLEQPWRHAIEHHARSLAVGAAVFVSPRIPADKQERAALVAASIQRLAARL